MMNDGLAPRKNIGVRSRVDKMNLRAEFESGFTPTWRLNDGAHGCLGCRVNQQGNRFRLVAA